ncbi:MAG: T9SS type A sorting domain-containing protein [Bacteroidota bacterium]|nr:T9SS type A sorting domain-containing protein [Bacteroidota bacterium]
MKKFLLLSAAFAMISGVYAKKVKVSVDMSGQTVDTSGVHVAGNFQGWSPNSTKLTLESGNIYSTYVDAPANQVMQFKFINGNGWSNSEGVPSLNQVGNQTNGGQNDNRWFYVDSISNDTSVIPAILFGGSAPAGKFAVRFAVDMQLQTVSSNGVHIAGSLQGWDPAATSMANLFDNNKVFEWIAYLDSATYQYKFINGNAWSGSESVPSACGVGNDLNRELAVSASAAYKVCFASCAACPSAPIPTYNATFVVDMLNNDCDGGFDSVSVAGGRAEITNWGNGVNLNKIGTTSIHGVTLRMDSGEFEFKFRFHKNGNTSWEGIANRKWILSKDDTLGLTCYNSSAPGPCIPKPAPSDVHFLVDLSNETPDGQGRVYVMGNFTTPNWQNGAIRLSPVAGKPGFYATTVNICPGSFAYKFVNGDSSVTASEENFNDTTQRACVVPNGVGGFNRTYTRISSSPVTLAYVFNTCNLADTTTTGLIEKNNLINNVKLYPNPSSSLVNIEFNDFAQSHNVIIMDIAGKTVATYNQIIDNNMVLNSKELSKGVHFVQITNNRGEAKTLKLIVQ